MRTRSAVVYTVLRLLAFLVPFGILMLFPIFRDLYWLAAIFAALIGLSLSLLFLRQPLDEVTSAIAQRRAERAALRSGAAADAAAEDAATEGVETEAARGPAAQPTNAQKRNAP